MKIQYVKIEEPKPELCQQCQQADVQEPHVCPYRVEIHSDEETLCNCCSTCTKECAEDI